MIKISQFKELVKMYREAKEVDVPAIAIRFAYSQLQQGVKTALTLNIEQYLKKDINSVFTPQPQPRESRVDLVRSKEFRGTDFAAPEMLDAILDPKYNDPHTRTQSYKTAISQGKKMVLSVCQVHGEALFRILPAKLQNGRHVYGGYCLECRASKNSTKPELRLKIIRDLKQRFIESLNQSAS